MGQLGLTSPEPSDEVLVGRVAHGDLTAYSLLYDRYDRPVYAMATHLLGAGEAEEVVQETFLRLWRSAAQFDETRGRFAPWLLAIARHEVLAPTAPAYQEQRLALAEDIDRLIATAPDPTIAVEEQVWRRERGDLILQALNELPPEQRRVLVLAFFGELSQTPSLLRSAGHWARSRNGCASDCRSCARCLPHTMRQ